MVSGLIVVIVVRIVSVPWWARFASPLSRPRREPQHRTLAEGDGRLGLGLESFCLGRN